jgi:hypothetical protein
MVVQNTFQILLTGEYTKSSIFYADVVIVYINPGGGHHDRDRDRMAVGFTTTCTISALAPPTLGFRITFMARCIRYNIK